MTLSWHELISSASSASPETRECVALLDHLFLLDLNPLSLECFPDKAWQGEKIAVSDKSPAYSAQALGVNGSPLAIKNRLAN